MHGLLSQLRFWRDHRWAPDRMSAYLDAELAPRGRERMQRHVSECPECRRLLAGLGLVVDGLRSLPSPESDTGAVQIAAAVTAQLSERP